VLEGIRYTAWVVGPTPWNTTPSRWKFWKRRPDPLEQLAADIVDFDGHPVPTRSRIQGAIPHGSLHTLPEEDLLGVLKHAISRAGHPTGNDLVVLARADERFVLSWGDWNSLGALLLAGGYEMEIDPWGPEISEQDALALNQLVSIIVKDGSTASAWRLRDLPDGFAEFLTGGAFHLTDIA
jgi:hypothetical protein